MSKRPLAALCALLAFMAALVAVPLATSEPAEAHTKTERRCTYNRQLSRPECQDVHVSHTHTDNTPEGRNGDSDGPRNGGIHTPATTAPPPATQPKQCTAGSHRYGNGCHSHSFTPPCGTGTWTPHAGHTAQQRPACPPPPKCADGYSGTPPNCVKDMCPAGTTGTPPNCVKDKPKTCPAGQTGTPPSCQTPPPPPTTTTAPPPCPKLLGTHPHLDREQHQHDGFGCHDATPCHVHTGGSRDNSEGTCRTGFSLEERLGQVSDLIATGTTASLSAARSALNKIATDVKDDAQWAADSLKRLHQEIDKLWKRVPLPAKAFITSIAGAAGCGALIAVAAKTTIASGGTAAPAWLTWVASPAGKRTIEVTCGGLVAAAVAVVEGGSGSDSGTDDDPEPTPDPNDPDGDYDGDGTTTAEEATEAAIKHQAGEITDAEYIRVLRRYWCGSGDPSYTSYCNE